MKAKELIRWIQDNNLEEYDIYVGGTTNDTCWVIDEIRLKHVEEKEDGYYHGRHNIKDGEKENAIIL